MTTIERQYEPGPILALSQRTCRVLHWVALCAAVAVLSVLVLSTRLNLLDERPGGNAFDITVNRISESMVAAITQVAKVMELDTVAEYVECRETLKLLAKLGVDYAQGHEIGRPRPLDDVLEELRLPAESTG